MEINKIIQHNVLQGLPLPDKSVNCCVTSPPYWGLRNYNNIYQLGLERTPEEYIANMVKVFMEVHRVLKDDGTCWLNIADSYAGSGKGVGSNGQIYGGIKQRTNNGSIGIMDQPLKANEIGLKPKDLVGIPWMLAFALRSAGWYLRQDIIWHKPNPMPESVTDRCTKSHEYIFLLSKSQKYYYDHEAIKTVMQDSSVSRLSQDVENQVGPARVPGKTNGKMKAVGGIFVGRDIHGSSKARGGDRSFNGGYPSEGLANKRSVWTVTTKPYSESHFATFPQDLITDCIKAGCPENGIVLDPFMGAGTTAVVARKLYRNFVGFELNPDYITIANKRLYKELGAFL